MNKGKIFLRGIAAAFVLLCVIAYFFRPGSFYASLTVTTPAQLPGDQVHMQFLFQAKNSLESCEALIGNVVRNTLSSCPNCRLEAPRCDTQLDESATLLLSERPLTTPSGLFPGGMVNFRASPAMAQGACQQAELQATGNQNKFICYAPGTPRLHITDHSWLKATWGLNLLLASLAAALIAWYVCWMIIKYEHLHAHLSHDHVDAGPQKFHVTPTPRIGGLGVMIGLLAGWGAMLVLANIIPAMAKTAAVTAQIGTLILAGSPAFIGGLTEDITKRVGVIERLLLTMIAGVMAILLLGGLVTRVDIPPIDALLSLVPVAILVTAIAVGGIANSINIVDGYNGLTMGLAVIVLGAFAYVGIQVGDTFILQAAFIIGGALLGVMRWNWPGGRIFLGDGGAYLLGFLLAEMAVLVVFRNQDVSPWFPLLLLIHPIFETFFSIYRRRFIRAQSPGAADALHLHTLIYRRVVSRSKYRSALERNNRVAPYIWAPTLLVSVYACIFWRSTPALCAGVLAYCAAYILVYRQIALLRRGGAAR